MTALRARTTRTLATLSLLVGNVAALAGVQAPASATPAAGVALQSRGAIETVRGPARISPLAGGGYLAAFAFGALVRHAADGTVVWQRDSSSLYRDWRLRWQNPAYVNAPQLPWGSDPSGPLEFAGAAVGLTSNVAPVAVGDLTGDGVPDFAVSDIVGVNTSAYGYPCPTCSTPFDVPGSTLHLGTFVSVLDGRSGRTVYSRLDPGFVTQLAITDRTLIVGDETGDPQSPRGIGAWNSATTVQAFRLPQRGPSSDARRLWTYTTGAPWARLLGIAVTGGSVAVAWSDTPLGLGTPAPPHGHVVLLDARSGRRHWDRRTAGYPVLIAADPARQVVATVQLADPAERVGYTVSALSLHSGAATVLSSRRGSVPTALTVVGGRGADSGWLVASVDGTVGGPFGQLDPKGGRVTLIAPVTGHARWSIVLPNHRADAPLRVAEPGSVAVVGDTVVVGFWLGAESPTPSRPRTETDGLVGLDEATGARRWQHVGDIGTPLSLSAGGNAVQAMTSNEVLCRYIASTGRLVRSVPEQADVLTTATATLPNGHHELIAGDQSGAVYGYAAGGLTTAGSGRPTMSWTAALSGPVRALQVTVVQHRTVVVAAATDTVAVIDAATGSVLHAIPVPHSFVWRIAVGSAHGQPAVFASTGSAVRAYALDTGDALWSYLAPAGATFADVAVSAGTVLTEYSDAPDPDGAPATAMAAVGLDEETGHARWLAPPDASVISGQLWDGVAAAPEIPAAGGLGAAFAWETADGGRIEVRDARTGRLDYANDSSELGAHTGYAVDPQLGLIAESHNSAVQVTPAGPQISSGTNGTSLTTVSAGSAGRVMIVGNGTLFAYAPTFDGDYHDPIAHDDTFLPGTVDRVDLGHGDEVAASPTDWVAYQAMNAATGQPIGAYREAIEHGLELVSAEATSGGTSANRMGPPAKQAPEPPRGPVAASPVPTPEPIRNGTATPQAVVLPADEQAAQTPYRPADIRRYLGLTGDGTGTTIAIVDAYSDPGIVSDVQKFSDTFKLPGVCGSGGTAGDCFDLTVTGGSSATDENWAMETALDVEWAHAVAPRARIVLVVAKDGQLASLFRAVSAATAWKPQAVSMSWGMSQEFSDEKFYDPRCESGSTICVVASGDDGHPGAYPADNPATIAVGGTTLNLNTDGSVSDEVAWAGSGGGRSWVEAPSPAQRRTLGNERREVPDIAFDADPETGVAVYDSASSLTDTGWLQVGGTSLGAPVWSALLADADQLRAKAGAAALTYRNGASAAVYALPRGALADITTGPANGFCPVGCEAGTGFDDVTGRGSPRTGVDATLARTVSRR